MASTQAKRLLTDARIAEVVADVKEGRFVGLYGHICPDVEVAVAYVQDNVSYAAGVKDAEEKYKLLHIQIRQLIACQRGDMLAFAHEGCVGAVEHALRQLEVKP